MMMAPICTMSRSTGSRTNVAFILFSITFIALHFCGSSSAMYHGDYSSLEGFLNKASPADLIDVVLQDQDSDVQESWSLVESNGDKANIQKRQIRENICDLGCRCTRDNKFVTVLCDFNSITSKVDAIFDDKYQLPEHTTSLIIKLAPFIRFRIDEDLFYRNRVNRLSIQGRMENEQVEIGSRAFRGNQGPFPEIEIINCHSVILRANAFSGEFTLNISNSADVIVFEDAFRNTSFKGYFSNIQDLRIQEKAFNNAKAQLDISSSNIENLHRFEASLREVRFYKCSIGCINSGTFDVYSINSLVFDSCRIDVIKARAITEKLYSDHLAITGAIIGIIESEAIAGSGISELILSRNEIDTIQKNAIHITSINATIVHNVVKHLGNQWIHVKDWSNITISKNQFGEFGAMVLEDTPKAKTCRFEENFITKPQPGSLDIKSRHCVLRQISFFQPCICNISWLRNLSARDLKSESYCTVDGVLKNCFNTTIFNVLKYEKEVCDYSKTQLDCMKNMQLKKINGEFLNPAELEDHNEKLKLVYMIAGLGLLVILVLIILISVGKCMTRGRVNTMPILDNASSMDQSMNGTGLKDNNEFSPDDRRIINQTLETIKQKYPAAIFERVYANTQVLLGGHITEMQRVKSIGEIVYELEKCQNPGEHFVAFTDILYRHLKSPGPTAPPPDPVYAEPGSTLRLQNNNVETDGLVDGLTNIDHIYAEPNNVQQPLLTNEYASPADRSEYTTLYSEPVMHERGKPPPNP